MLYQTEQREELDAGIRWRAYTATLERIEGVSPEFVALAQGIRRFAMGARE